MKFHRIRLDPYSRGYYISVWNNPLTEGLLYLCKDGSVHKGVRETPSTSFWETEEDAITFYNEWRKINDK